MLATTITGSTLRSAGWSAIASGVAGILALGTLVLAVVYMYIMKSSGSEVELFGFVNSMLNAHLVGLILQFGLMIPVVFGLHALARQNSPDLSRTALVLGVVSLSLGILCALLYFAGVVADTLYMVPQGAVGLWVVIVSRRLSRPGSRVLARFGMVVGFGLLLVGTFPLAYGIFVDSIILRGPVPPDYPDKDSVANGIIHIVLLIGTLLGVLPFPVWSILLGRRLLRAENYSPGRIC